MLLLGKSVWKKFLCGKPVFTETILLFIRQNTFHMVKGIINAFDRMGLCLVINLTMGGNGADTLPLIIASRYISFAATLNTRGDH